jgi:hypothetical protein
MFYIVHNYTHKAIFNYERRVIVFGETKARIKRLQKLSRKMNQELKGNSAWLKETVMKNGNINYSKSIN